MTTTLSGRMRPTDQPSARNTGPARGSLHPTDWAASAPTGRRTPNITYDISNEGARQCRST